MELVLFDVNETLIDVTSVHDRVADLGVPPLAAASWFPAVLRDGMAAAAMGDLVTFPDLARHHLAELFTAHGIGDPRAVDEVLDAFAQASFHPDVRDGLQRLADAGVRAATLTNGTAEMSRGWFRAADLGALVEALLDVHAAGIWKPHPDAYLWACDHLGASAGAAALVAVHPWDVAGAVRAGLTGAFLDRGGRAYPDGFAPPTVTATTLPDLVDALLAV